MSWNHEGGEENYRLALSFSLPNLAGALVPGGDGTGCSGTLLP